MNRALALLALTGACAAPPPRSPADRCDPGAPPARVDRCLGEAVDGLLTRSLPVLREPTLELYLGRVGARVARATGAEDARWTFRLLEDAEPQGFAVVGGFVYVTSGAVAALDSEAELAALLAHEIAHVVAGHARMSFDDELGSCTRTQGAKERQADELAIGFLAAAGYEPRALASMLARIDPGDESGTTHPSAPARLARAARLTHRLPRGELARDRFRAHRRLLVRHVETRRGAFAAGRYTNRSAGLTVNVPGDWTADAGEGWVVFHAGDDARGLLLPMSPVRASVVAAQLEEPEQRTIAGVTARIGWLREGPPETLAPAQRAIRAAIVGAGDPQLLLLVTASEPAGATAALDALFGGVHVARGR